MKLEVGMYVRTKEGNIEKICAIENTHIYTDEDYLSWYGNYNAFSKASHNIIDLIEPLDLMYIDIEPNDGYGGIVVPRVAETLNELEKWKKRLESGECKLVYITTHEQIESMQYRVD